MTKPKKPTGGSGEDVAKKYPNLRPFKPGESGNINGFNGLGGAIREVFGKDGRSLAEFARALIAGDPLPGPLARKVRLKDALADKDRLWVVARVEERVAMFKIIAEQGWGKPKQDIRIEPTDQAQTVDLSRLSDAELATFETLLTKAARPPEPVVDAEAEELAPPAPVVTRTLPVSSVVTVEPPPFVFEDDPKEPQTP